MQYQDIAYETKNGIATITMNRPEKRNAVRPLTYEELTHAMHQYTAQQALDMGLINFVAKAEALDALVDEWCQEILNKSPQSIRIAKIALNAGSDQEFYPSYPPSSALLASIYGNEENMEGIRVFLEKRKSDFRQYRRKGK